MSWGNALLLSTLAGLSTGLGGIILICLNDATRVQSAKRLGLWEAAVAGFMLAISFGDLLPEALASNALSVPYATMYFCMGCAGFAIIKRLLPEPELVDFVESHFADVLSKPRGDTRSRRQLLFTGVLTAISIAIHNIPEGARC